jgi:hypothetical protein
MKDISRLYLSALDQVKKDLKKEEEQSKSDNKEVNDEHPNKRKQFKFVVKNLKLLTAKKAQEGEQNNIINNEETGNIF